MTDPLRDRIAAIIKREQGPGGGRYRGSWDEHVADAVIRDLGLQTHLAKRIINGKPDQWVRRHVTDWEME